VLDPTKLIIIAVVAFLFFGPDKLPQIARTVGRFMREFKKVQEEMETTIRSEMYKADLAGAQAADPNPTVAAASVMAADGTPPSNGGWDHESADEEDEE
jgi:sec-independent protein translocase protein TatB